MPVTTMKNLFHLPVMSRNPGVHPSPQTGNITLSQSSVSMIANCNGVNHQDTLNINRSATLNGPLSSSTSMGDIKQTKLSTIVSKKANRAKEMFLQNLGKAEKTKDELFEMYQANFYKQQSHALKLHKEIKNYIQCLKTMQEATRNLNLCLQESHGKESPRHDLFCENILQIEQLYDQLSEKLRTNVLANIEEYLGQFNEVREKIAKRGRKLIDYDSAKRSYELVQAANNKKPLRDETRLNKSREHYEQARHMYQSLNNELHNELPALYESRIPYILLTLQTYCNTQINFHQTNGKLYASCHDAIDLLATLSSLSYKQQQQQQQHNNNNNNSNNNNNNSKNTNNNSCIITDETYPNQIKSTDATTNCQQQQQQQLSGVIRSESVYSQQPMMVLTNGNNPMPSETTTTTTTATESRDQDEESNKSSANLDSSIIIKNANKDAIVNSSVSITNEQQKDHETAQNDSGLDVVLSNVRGEKLLANTDVLACKPQAIPAGATTTDLPEGVLYKVKTSYKYMAEDVDELCFEADEILHVIEYEDPLEQEEGWLMGLREVNGQRGLFPANFTRVI